MSEPVKVSVSVGLTISPKPYESVRVDFTLHEVSSDTVDAALEESRPLIERVFGALLQRALEAVEEGAAVTSGDQPRVHVSNSYTPSPLSMKSPTANDAPPPVGQPYAAPRLDGAL